MGAAIEQEKVEGALRDRIRSRVQLIALGNTKRSLRNVVVDLINASDMDWEDIARGTFLAKSTIAKLAKDVTVFPRIDTVERLLTFFEYNVTLGEVEIKAKFRNKPKNLRGAS